MTKHKIARAEEIEAGNRIIAEVDGVDITVFNVDGEYRAYANWCGHQGGPCGEGTVSGTTTATFDRETLETRVSWNREGKVLSCPWHGWEYDLTTGECLSNRRYRLIEYEVNVVDGDVIVRV